MTGKQATGSKARSKSVEPSPMGRLGETIGRIPRYLMLAAALLRDPKLGRWRKAGLAASLAYVASPIDFVPGIIPVAGQLDDLAALLLGIRNALRGCSPTGAAAHLKKARLTATDIDNDLATVRASAGWIAGHVGAATVRLGRFSVKGAGKLLGIGARGARTLAAEAAKRVR
jgi:uncharacterized membrane protein YkvA (DUF1232 family)